MKTDIYNIEGKKAGSVELPETVFGVAWNDSLMHQVVTSMQDNARTPVAHTKGRSEVRGGGKKPWQQKGTGRARHSSIRSPIWRGGGVTHGPLNAKVFARGIPKKMRAKALFMALSKKMKDGQILFVDSFGFTVPKTADAKKALLALSGVKGFERLSTKRVNAGLVALSQKNEAVEKSFRNIGSITATDVRSLNPVAVLKATYILIENPAESLALVESRMNKKA
ncbi:50S ribosomal protein L4 [Candidatus Kaiserbacteria bacterium]|nr:50S ribosomal protein L4 [Candidatus Kaiserbacteria bacterium]